MCFSEKASLFAFIFGMFGAYLVYTINTPFHKTIGMFFMYIAFIQLIEYILWRNQTCNIYNKFASIAGMILNNSQPIVMGLIILYCSPYLEKTIFTIPLYNNNSLKINGENIIYTLLVIYTILIIPYSWQYINQLKSNNSKNRICTLKNPDTKHLRWDWNYSKYNYHIYYLFLFLFIVFPIVGFPKNYTGLLLAIIISITYIYSLTYYNKNLGSIWCYFSVFIPIIYYILYRFNIFRFAD